MSREAHSFDPEPTAGHNLLVVFSTSLPGIPGPSIRTQKGHESGPHSSLPFTAPVRIATVHTLNID